MMVPALVILSDRDNDAQLLPAVATVSKHDAGDHGGYELGVRVAALGHLWVDRPYFVGNPSVGWMVAEAESVIRAGGYVQIGNEQNHPDEHWQGDAEAYQRFYEAVAAEVSDPTRLLYSPPSPGFEGWRRWVGVGHAYAIHAYGSFEQMQEVVQWYLEHTTGDLFVTECNPGAGNRFDLNAWAEGPFKAFLDWCATHDRIKTCAYFAWAWDQSPRLPSSIDAKGTRVVDVLTSWRAPIAASPSPLSPPVSGTGSETAQAPQPITGASHNEAGVGGDAQHGETGVHAATVNEVTPQPAALPDGVAPMPVNPPRADLVAYARNAAVTHGFSPDTFEAQVNQESGFRHWGDDGELLGSSAGAQGIAQIVKKWHDVDLSEPWPSLDYAASWMGQLLTRYGDVIHALVTYNGGLGAVEAWERGEPYDESVQYVDRILGYLTIPQFGGPLEGWGFGPDWVGSACGPLAVAGMARALGLPAPPADVLRSAPECGWTPEGGMNGPANLTRLLRRWRMEAVEVDADLVVERLRHGRPVIVSTSHHYYIAQRASRTDDDLLVGNSGQARRGGGPWMSLEGIRVLDSGINALFCAERTGPAVAIVDPIVEATDNLFDLTLSPGPHSEERRRSAQLAITVLKKALEVA